MKRSIFLVLFTIVISIVSFTQTSTLEVVCFVETQGGDPIITAKAELYEGNNKVQTASTDLKGKISFNLSFNKSYKIIVTKAGMIQKRIDFKTEVSDENQRSLKKEFAMSLVEDCEGANTSVFKEPVDIIQYDAGFGNFVSDKSHFAMMQSKFASAYRDIDRCKQEKFDEKKREADQQFNQGNFEESIKIYEEALKMSPNDGATKKQISQARKNIEKSQANSQKYDLAIREGDQYLAQNNLNAAKLSYADAQRLKPGDTYAQESITKINSILAQQQAEMQKQEAVNSEYNSVIKQGNAAMAVQNYPLAQQMFEKAASLKPNEAFASQKVAEAQQAIQNQQAQQAEADRVNEAYSNAMGLANAAMQQGDYILAQTHYQTAITIKPSETLPRQKINEAQKLEAQRQKDLLAQQKADVEQRYMEAITKADALVVQNQYPDAIGSYEQALGIKPSDKYAKQQIVKINNLIVEEEQSKLAAIEQQYNQAIALGDSKKLNKEFSAAVTAYQQALVAKPNDAIANSKLSEAQKLLVDKERFDKEMQENKARYNELIQQADGLFQSQDYQGSKTNYQQALVIYATEQYPKNQVAKIDNILERNKKEAEYNRIVAEADGLFNQENWENAKIKYTSAQIVLPEKDYPRQKINEINQKVSNGAKAAQEARYNDLVGQAEQQVTQKNFEQAKSIYSQAMLVLPENPYPQKRINEINQLEIDEAKALIQSKYDELAAKAEQQVTQKSFDEAKSLYSEASQIMPQNPYPRQRINEINQLMGDDAKAAVEAKYNEFAAQAEQQVTQKNFEQAKSLYSQAMQVIPDNPYPQQRINEINNLIDAEARQGKLSEYNQLIGEADKFFDSQNYEQARGVYTKAMGVIPAEKYPQQRINEINKLISNNSHQKIVDDYTSKIAEADNLFDQKNYPGATSSYTAALAIMPEQSYPQQRINEINSILTEQSRLVSDQEESNRAYNQTITLADKYFNDNNFPLAITEYNKAVGMRPQEVYPKQQIDKINQQLSKQQQLEAQRLQNAQKYTESIAKADEQFKAKNYTNAKISYNEALNYKPDDVHATSQIQRIDQIAQEASATNNKKQEKQEQYDKYISGGDKFYAVNQLIEAKQAYIAALEIIPGKEYPRGQIRKIDEKLRVIAANQSAVKTTIVQTSTSRSAPSENSTKANSEKAKTSFSSENERQKYLNNLKSKYGEGITKESYSDNSSTTTRFVIIRNDEVKEFLEIRYKWGGAQYKYNGKPTNSQYFNIQTKKREGESFTELKK